MSYTNYTGENYQMNQGDHAENNSEGTFTDHDRIRYNTDKALKYDGNVNIITPRPPVSPVPKVDTEKISADLQAKKRGMDFSQSREGKRLARKAERANAPKRKSNYEPGKIQESMQEIYGSIYNAAMEHLKK